MRSIFIILILLSSSARADSFENGRCYAYAEISQDTFSYLYKEVPSSELSDYFSPSKLNEFFKEKTARTSTRSSTDAFARVVEASITIRNWEKKAMINIGIAQKGIDASDKYIECATDDGNIKIIKNKKAGLKEIIKDIESSQALLNEMMTELEDAYKEDRSYKLVFKANKGDSKIKTFFRQVFKSTVNLTSHDNPKTIYVTPTGFEMPNECYFVATFNSSDKQNITLNLNFQEGIGWAAPRPGINAQFNGTAGNTLLIGDEISKLKYIQFDDIYMTDTMGEYLAETHKRCWKK